MPQLWQLPLRQASASQLALLFLLCSRVAFPANAYVAAVVSTCLTTALTLPLWRRWCLRTGLVDDPGYRKIHAQPIPLAGGLAVMTGLLVPACLSALLLYVQQRAGISLLPES